MKPYFTFKDKVKRLGEYRENGNPKGLSTGWNGLDKYMTIMRGYPIFVAGSPHSGKTEFILELMLSLSINHKFKWFVYCGEIGGVHELIAELCYKLTGKPYIKSSQFAMNEPERIWAEQIISEHFYFLDTEDSESSITEFKVEDFYRMADEAEKELGISFNGTLIDPWNDIVNEVGDYGGREDIWLQNALKCVRADSKKRNRVNIIVNHISDIKPVIDKNTGKRYIPTALQSEWAGGRTWWRRAFLMILVYRPPIFLCDENGKPYEPNESHIVIQKAKPKGSAKIGKHSLYWDRKTNRYYEKDEYGEMRSPFVTKKEPQQNLIIEADGEDPF